MGHELDFVAIGQALVLGKEQVQELKAVGLDEQVVKAVVMALLVVETEVAEDTGPEKTVGVEVDCCKKICEVMEENLSISRWELGRESSLTIPRTRARRRQRAGPMTSTPRRSRL